MKRQIPNDCLPDVKKQRVIPQNTIPAAPNNIKPEPKRQKLIMPKSKQEPKNNAPQLPVNQPTQVPSTNVIQPTSSNQTNLNTEPIRPKLKLVRRQNNKLPANISTMNNQPILPSNIVQKGDANIQEPQKQVLINNDAMVVDTLNYIKELKCADVASVVAHQIESIENSSDPVQSFEQQSLVVPRNHQFVVESDDEDDDRNDNSYELFQPSSQVTKIELVDSSFLLPLTSNVLLFGPYVLSTN
jgi:hypothetical protein